MWGCPEIGVPPNPLYIRTMYICNCIYAFMCRSIVCAEFRQKSAKPNGLLELTNMFADDTTILVLNSAVTSSFFVANEC